MYLRVLWTSLANCFKQFWCIWLINTDVKIFMFFAILSSTIDWWTESLSDRKKKVQCVQRDKKGTLHAQEEFPWGIPGSVDDHWFPRLAEHLRVTRRVFTICRFQSPVSNLLHLYLQSRPFFFLILDSLSVLSGFLSNTWVQVISCLSLPSSNRHTPHSVLILMLS